MHCCEYWDYWSNLKLILTSVLSFSLLLAVKNSKTGYLANQPIYTSHKYSYINSNSSWQNVGWRSSSFKLSNEWLATLWEYNRTDNRNNAIAKKTITAANNQKNDKLRKLLHYWKSFLSMEAMLAIRERITFLWILRLFIDNKALWMLF